MHQAAHHLANVLARCPLPPSSASSPPPSSTPASSGSGTLDSPWVISNPLPFTSASIAVRIAWVMCE